jgi:hypothetical protein
MKIVIVETPRPLNIEHYNDVANAPLSASLNSGYALAVARTSGWDTAYLDLTNDAGNTAAMAARILAEDGDLTLMPFLDYTYLEYIRSFLPTLCRCSGGHLFCTLCRNGWNCLFRDLSRRGFLGGLLFFCRLFPDDGTVFPFFFRLSPFPPALFLLAIPPNLGGGGFGLAAPHQGNNHPYESKCPAQYILQQLSYLHKSLLSHCLSILAPDFCSKFIVPPNVEVSIISKGFRGWAQ